jgi:hypothetical protein
MLPRFEPPLLTPSEEAPFISSVLVLFPMASVLMVSLPVPWVTVTVPAALMITSELEVGTKVGDQFAERFHRPEPTFQVAGAARAEPQHSTRNTNVTEKQHFVALLQYLISASL